ncbi:MAG TPA: B12-binding domain-containing radical SAM protein [Chthoniobacterales bacterium]|nr:B12-binding domain-containing radical SAM protein [Chthoniobacterales bacterium]
MAKRIQLFAPLGTKMGTQVHDGELLYLAQFLFDNGYCVKVTDCYLNPDLDPLAETRAFKPDLLVVHLWKNELIVENKIMRLLSLLEVIKARSPALRVVAIGSIATSVRDEILEWRSVVDAIVSETCISYRQNVRQEIVELALIQDYFSRFVKITNAFLSSGTIQFGVDDVVSVYSSRGCQKKCSFCSYNSYTTRWKDRDISGLADDIAVIRNHTSAIRFSLFDSNFGAESEVNQRKSALLAERLTSIPDLKLTLNVSSDGLSEEVIANFRRANVVGLLIGLESLNPRTLLEVYHKRQDINHATEMIEFAESQGITPIVSYILFHPWLTLDALRDEIQKIDAFGRHRIIQFAAKSRLQVIPKTPIERMLREQNLLVEGKFFRDFLFKDNDVRDVFLKLKIAFDRAIGSCRTFADLADLKMREWAYLREIVS